MESATRKSPLLVEKTTLEVTVDKENQQNDHKTTPKQHRVRLFVLIFSFTRIDIV